MGILKEQAQQTQLPSLPYLHTLRGVWRFLLRTGFHICHNTRSLRTGFHICHNTHTHTHTHTHARTHTTTHTKNKTHTCTHTRTHTHTHIVLTHGLRSRQYKHRPLNTHDRHTFVLFHYKFKTSTNAWNKSVLSTALSINILMETGTC